MNTNLQQANVIATASGKGGVGKSIFCVNLAGTLVKMGYKVAIIDADLGMSNCATLLNETTPGTARDVMEGQVSITDIIHSTVDGITLVTGSDVAGISPSSIYPVLDDVIISLQQECDFILIDTPAGASELSLWALDRSDLCTLIIADEPTVISDAYRFCKFVLEIDPAYPFGLAVNFAQDVENARDVAGRFNAIISHFMNRNLPYFGFLPLDERVRRSVHHQKPFIHEQDHTDLHKALEQMANNIIHQLKSSLTYSSN